ncbi:MAG TPA: hypothetical protein VK716_16605 [Terracidiphilus sp.]|nr:hypothetical protein [Terracidiphilus sp.]
MASAAQEPAVHPGNGLLTEEQRRLAEQERTQRARRMQALHLQRENILSQRTSSPARRSALEAALQQIDKEIEALN